MRVSQAMRDVVTLPSTMMLMSIIGVTLLEAKIKQYAARRAYDLAGKMIRGSINLIALAERLVP